MRLGGNMVRIVAIAVLLACSTLVAEAQSATVISQNANLRGTPSSNGKVVEKLSQGTVVDVIQQRGAWFLVQSTDYAGWMHGNALKIANSFLTLEPQQIPQVEQPARQAPTETKSTPAQPAYTRGPRGGCYYISSSGRKVYVDRNLCN